MNRQPLSQMIEEQMTRVLWEVENIIAAAPDALWSKLYCDMPLWKHIYHMLHSLDLWFINPRDKYFKEPDIHVPDLNNLDITSDRSLSREEIQNYYNDIRIKIENYASNLQDQDLAGAPEGCEYSRLTLVLAQLRHLNTHMGMIMGFVIADTGLWPRVVGLEAPIPTGNYSKYF